jgi:outer membrane protein assembly factor BamB
MKHTRWIYVLTLLAAVGLLSACSSTVERPKPQEVVVKDVLQDVKPLWTTQIGSIDFALQVGARGDWVALANAEGKVSVLSASSGKTVWSYDIKQPLAAGVGTDGQQVAVVTRGSELVVLNGGKVQWRTLLTTGSFTPPLIAGGRVFVLTSDRKVLAFDGADGQLLWSQQKAAEPLVLKAPGILQPFKNTLLASMSGRLVGIDPNNGLIRWEAALATPRGTNDVERLVDLVGPAHREDDIVCVRAFQSQVGCVNAQREQVLWTRTSVGETNVDGNANLLVGVQSNGVVQAWNRANGARAWDTERLKYHIVGAPLMTPRGVLMADDGGWLYVLSLADGAVLNRIKLPGDEPLSPLVRAGDVYVAVTRSGTVTGLQLP